MSTDDDREPIQSEPASEDQDTQDGNWVGPDSNPAAAGDEPDEGWMGPESNPASGSSS